MKAFAFLVLDGHFRYVREIELMPLDICISKIGAWNPSNSLLVKHFAKSNTGYAAEPAPRPASRQLKRNLILNADRLGVTDLLIMQISGSAACCEWMVF